MALVDLLYELAAEPALRYFTLEQATSFIRLTSILKHDIQLPQPIVQTNNEAPEILPPSISLFLSQALAIPLAAVARCWDILKDEAWRALPAPFSEQDEVMFREYGWKLGLSTTGLHTLIEHILMGLSQHHSLSTLQICVVATQIAHGSSLSRSKRVDRWLFTP
jgi:hypothetical protein